MQITEFRGKKWTIGLDWEILPNEDAIKQEAKNVAEKTNANFGIMISYEDTYAIGLSQKVPKVDSAAIFLALANQEARNNGNLNETFADWIVIEEVGDDKYWMAVIKEGLPAPQYDAVFSLTTIREKFTELMANDTYTFYSSCTEIATLFDGLKYVEPKSLNDLTAEVKTKLKFDKLRGIPNSVIYLGIGLVGLAILLWILSSFIEGRSLKEKAASFKRQQEQQEKIAQEQYNSDVKIYNDSIAKSKIQLKEDILSGLAGTPSKILTAWYQTVSAHELGTHGWDLKKIECYFYPVSNSPLIKKATYPLACDFNYARNGLTTNRMLLQDYPTAQIAGNEAVVTQPIQIDSNYLVVPPETILNDLPEAKNWGFDMISQLQLLKIVNINYQTKSSVDMTFTAPIKPVTPADKKQGKLPTPGGPISVGIGKGELTIRNDNLELLKELVDNVDFKAVGVKKATFLMGGLGEVKWEVTMDYFVKSQNGGVVGANSDALSNSAVSASVSNAPPATK